MDDFRSYATMYYLNYGWVTHPLGLDTNGLPKRPITKDWTNIEDNQNAIESLNWADAKGMGLLTGSKSGVGVIDIDDAELALLLPMLWEHYPLMVSTARNRAHVYVQEADGPSGSSKFFCNFRGKEVCIELKGNGTQVALPPSPGYSWRLCHPKTADHISPPLLAFSLASAWEFIMDAINAEYGNDTISMTQPMSDSAGYPKAWQSSVSEGQRNDSVYVESHRLKKSGMTEDQAIDVMLRRVEKGYDGVMTEQEIISTVKSAYKKSDERRRNGQSNERDEGLSLQDLFGSYES